MEKVLEVQGAIGTLKLGFVRFCPIPFHDNGFLYLSMYLFISVIHDNAQNDLGSLRKERKNISGSENV